MDEFNPLESVGTKLNRWFDYGRKRGVLEGIDSERERIIALLENAENHIDANPEWYAGIFHAVALIKGENNE